MAALAACPGTPAVAAEVTSAGPHPSPPPGLTGEAGTGAWPDNNSELFCHMFMEYGKSSQLAQSQSSGLKSQGSHSCPVTFIGLLRGTI